MCSDGLGNRDRKQRLPSIQKLRSTRTSGVMRSNLIVVDHHSLSAIAGSKDALVERTLRASQPLIGATDIRESSEHRISITDQLLALALLAVGSSEHLHT